MYTAIPCISKHEVLRYLGYRGGKLSSEMDTSVEQGIQTVLQNACPRYCIQRFPLERDPEGIRLAGTVFRLLGEDIQSLLASCESAVLLAVTLGNELETLIRRAQTADLTQALILDSCASCGVEAVCQDMIEKLEKEAAKEGLFLTDRFSPGYGDMPLSQQEEFCRTLGSAQKIGLLVHEKELLLPQKSITAIIGVSSVPQLKRARGCKYCKHTCSFRKEGLFCDSISSK